MKNGSRQDAELKQILFRNDPAGIVDPDDSARLEMFINDRVFYQPQPQLDGVGINEFFVIPAMMRGALSWPTALVGTMALGLVLGFFVASLSETSPVASYNIAANGPWQHLMQ